MGLFYTISSNIKLTDVLITSLSIICLYVFRFYYKHFNRVNPLPGPIPIPLIGSLAIFIKDIDAWFHELKKTYGNDGVYELNIVGNRQIVITRAEYIDKFLTSSVNSHIMRTANNGLLDLFDLEKKGVGLNHNYEYWKFNRQIFSQTIMPLCYTPKPSKYLNNLFEEMSNYWMDLKPKGDESVIIDIAPWMRRFTSDFISVLTTEKRNFSIQYYYRKLNNEAMTEEMIESESFSENINKFVADNQIIFIPKVLRNIPFIRNRVDKMLNNNNTFYGKLEDIVRKRRKEIEKAVNSKSSSFFNALESNKLDLLTSMIITNTSYDTRPPQKNTDPSLSRPMTDGEIRGILFDAFVAGTDTTVNTFCFVLYYISHHPDVKKKMLEEIETVFKDDPNRPITLDDLEKLRYCEAIIKETSRIRPTVSMISRYSNQPEEVAGYKWPSNTLFIMYVRGINNNPRYWKNPDEFIPERFYEPKEMENRQKNSFLMFGGGLRMCLGRKVAMIELKTLLAALYRKFDVELVDKEAPLDIETSTITVCNKLDIKLTPRN